MVGCLHPRAAGTHQVSAFSLRALPWSPQLTPLSQALLFLLHCWEPSSPLLPSQEHFPSYLASTQIFCSSLLSPSHTLGLLSQPQPISVRTLLLQDHVVGPQFPCLMQGTRIRGLCGYLAAQYLPLPSLWRPGPAGPPEAVGDAQEHPACTSTPGFEPITCLPYVNYPSSSSRAGSKAWSCCGTCGNLLHD